MGPVAQSVASPIGDPGVVSLTPSGAPYFHGNLSCNISYGHSPLYADSKRLLSVTNKSMYMEYWLTAESKLDKEKVCLG